MMTPDQRKADEAARLKLQRTFASRLEKLAKRKVAPMTQKQFADKYNLDDTGLSRMKGVLHAARWTSINPVDEALRAENC